MPVLSSARVPARCGVSNSITQSDHGLTANSERSPDKPELTLEWRPARSGSSVGICSAKLSGDRPFFISKFDVLIPSERQTFISACISKRPDLDRQKLERAMIVVADDARQSVASDPAAKRLSEEKDLKRRLVAAIEAIAIALKKTGGAL